MQNNITELQWEYLGKPKGICILQFEDGDTHMNALHWVDTIWRIPWEILYVDVKKENDVVPWTIVIPDNMFERFCHPYRGMAGKFEAEWLEI
ncbi:MAG: hypothetical protein UR66_C0003G0111 [Candidatus Moranbacteria bacterium GW2011_GWE1_35_17]|nr:MAG: hypothetical protein UR66_C0003G0111 [Candidatus Moranbacteria bacterium GW2011_GWE1_35_17]KKP69875.1 MAG: hypothetical protein UR65_C0046G0002 [Candidatus Moranbacteria bacterium GW2011_GWE2_35_164]KKP82083.1 MAG: hypothetical protein UR82_C0044G0015 [Candidatus Moranbacteria bacterium GW2011_GWF1_35_5]KKP84395.1 MAG: hypothetical protein UR83_C0022G0032 [Candidatus Moranbacteria bacterium GW2011_GWF2_35_54]